LAPARTSSWPWTRRFYCRTRSRRVSLSNPEETLGRIAISPAVINHKGALPPPEDADRLSLNEDEEEIEGIDDSEYSDFDYFASFEEERHTTGHNSSQMIALSEEEENWTFSDEESIDYRDP
jgi:hypothetical protein